MYLRRFYSRQAVISAGCILFLACLSQVSLASTISGYVYGLNRVALFEVDMELLNENYQLRARTRTDGTGRYEFKNLTDGQYTIRALPFRYDYQDQEVKVRITTINVRGSGQGNTYITQDFNLVPKKGGITEYELGVVFAQDVPGEAARAYKKADRAFSRGRNQEGVDELMSALRAYPEYYYALYRMGKELYTLRQYKDAWRFLMKATEVNPRSGVAFYYLGECFHQLGKDYWKAAVTALTEASILIPNMPQIFYTLGRVERFLGRFSEAEAHLLRAKDLAKRPVPEIQSELAQLYGNDLKKYKEAADELELYLKASDLDGEESKKIREKIAELRKKGTS